VTAIEFSASGSAANVTGSFTVSLGGTPNVGDLVVVYLGISNQIVTHQPGYNTATQWFQMGSLRSRLNGSTLSAYYHTWNASDSGSSVTFTVSPAPSLGIGDTDLSTCNVVWIAVVLTGPTGLAGNTVQGSYDPLGTVSPDGVKKAVSSALEAAYSLGPTSINDSDGSAVSVQQVTDGSQVLAVYQRQSPAVGYRPTYTANGLFEVLAHVSLYNDSPTFLYNPPIIYEGPVAEDELLFRYTLTRYYTVLNNAGVFSAVRYSSTDQLNAATQVFTNNAPVSSTDRTNILNSGVGGDFVSA
jgi:hypothetical protein